LKSKGHDAIREHWRSYALFKQARDFRNSITGVAKKSDSQLREKDFDNLVTFFCR
jgi:hypothetical protein